MVSRRSRPRAVVSAVPLRSSTRRPFPAGGVAARAALLAATLALLAVGLVLGGARAQGSAEPAPPLPADLAFVAPDGRLAWLPAGATSARPIGSPQAEHAFPAWSPDGRRLAAIARGDGAARAVVLELPPASAADAPLDAPADAAAVRVATWFDEPGAPVIYLDWSDDGRSLLALVGDAASGFTLRRVGPDGDEILARGAPLYWDQRPGGGLIVHTGGPGAARLFLLDDAGREVAELDAPGFFRSPAASPSGRWLAFAVRGPGDVRRAVVRRAPDALEADAAGAGSAGPDDGESGGAVVPRLGDAAARRELNHRGLTALAWHPRRDLLALTRPLRDAPHAFGPLGGLDADSGLFEPWVEDSVLAFWWAPDGGSLAVLTSGAPGGGQLASVPAAGASSLGASPARVGLRARPLQARPAGLRLGLVDPAGGGTRWLAEVTPGRTFLAERLPFADQYARSHALWSPDGRWLALGLQDAAGREVIGVIDVETGEQREVAPGAMPAWSPAR